MKHLRLVALLFTIIASPAFAAVDNQVYVLNNSSQQVTVTLRVDNADSNWIQKNQGKKYKLQATMNANGDKNWIHAGGNGILGFSTSDGVRFNAPGAPLTASFTTPGGGRPVVLAVTFGNGRNGRPEITNWQTADRQGQGGGFGGGFGGVAVVGEGFEGGIDGDRGDRGRFDDRGDRGRFDDRGNRDDRGRRGDRGNKNRNKNKGNRKNRGNKGREGNEKRGPAWHQVEHTGETEEHTGGTEEHVGGAQDHTGGAEEHGGHSGGGHSGKDNNKK